MKFLLLFLFVISFHPEALAKTEVLFTPSLRCENKIEQLIDQSKHNVDIVVYSINNTKLVEAIERAYGRGVKIRVLTDRLQASGKHSLVTRLYKKGINVRVHSVHKIEHNKFAIYDGKKLQPDHIIGLSRHLVKIVKIVCLLQAIKK